MADSAPRGRHYLDHASTVPLRPEAAAALRRWLEDTSGLGDPGRIHVEGLAARGRVEDARDQVAELFGCRPREVVFTSGATESIVTAINGARGVRGTHVVCASVEHSAVRAAAARGPHTVVGCDRTGRVEAAELLAAVTADTAVVCLQLANHEVGTVQDVATLAAGCNERGVLLHVDAAQAAGRIPIDLADLGADLVSVSGHKLGAPPGVGALLVRRGLRIAPLLEGGDQERARRAGLENLPGIVGFGAACAALSADDRLARETAAARAHTDRLRALVDRLDGVTPFGHTTQRLPHLVCVGIDDVEPQAVLLGLDRAGIAAHSGSACASESLEPSPVLEAMGVDAHHSLRLSVGWNTTDTDIAAVEVALPQVLDELRALRRRS